MVSAVDRAKRALVTLLKTLATAYGIVLNLKREPTDAQPTLPTSVIVDTAAHVTHARQHLLCWGYIPWDTCYPVYLHVSHLLYTCLLLRQT